METSHHPGNPSIFLDSTELTTYSLNPIDVNKCPIYKPTPGGPPPISPGTKSNKREFPDKALLPNS